eukprot:scaffold120829_cov45-Phaeocystis_antarctica.AAC.1
MAPSMLRVQLVPVDAPLSMSATSLPCFVVSSMLARDAELGSFRLELIIIIRSPSSSSEGSGGTL